MMGMGRRTIRTIQDMHSLAKARGGKCLSTEYINISTKLQWQCAKGHIWEAVYNKSWCQHVLVVRKKL